MNIISTNRNSFKKYNSLRFRHFNFFNFKGFVNFVAVLLSEIDETFNAILILMSVLYF